MIYYYVASILQIQNFNYYLLTMLKYPFLVVILTSGLQIKNMDL